MIEVEMFKLDFDTIIHLLMKDLLMHEQLITLVEVWMQHELHLI